MGVEKPLPTGRAALTQLTGMGVELAASVLVFCGVGYWIDYHWPNVKPWGFVSCSILGIVGGLYNLIRKAIHQSLGIKPPPRLGSQDKPPDSGSPGAGGG